MLTIKISSSFFETYDLYISSLILSTTVVLYRAASKQTELPL